MSKKKSSNSAPVTLKANDTFLAAIKIVNAGTGVDPQEYFSALEEVHTGVDDLIRQAGMRASEFSRNIFWMLATSEEGQAFLANSNQPNYENPTQDAIDEAISYLELDLDPEGEQ